MDIKRKVREKYGDLARRVRDRSRENGPGAKASCCGSDAGEDAITANLYEAGDLAGVPEDAIAASLGCGNPAALARLEPGEIVLDLGSGGGLDVILSARRVGPAGKVYGLDMTDEMLEVARRNQRKAGVENVEFIKGEIENIPLPEGSADVVISNCVINLSRDKARVLREAFRVLKPGGRLAVSDIVARGPIPDEVRRDAELWAGCIAGTLEEEEYRTLLREAGFVKVEIEPTRVFRLAPGGCCGGARLEADEALSREPESGTFMSAFLRAEKPA